MRDHHDLEGSLLAWLLDTIMKCIWLEVLMPHGSTLLVTISIVLLYRNIVLVFFYCANICTVLRSGFCCRSPVPRCHLCQGCPCHLLLASHLLPSQVSHLVIVLKRQSVSCSTASANHTCCSQLLCRQLSWDSTSSPPAVAACSCRHGLLVVWLTIEGAQPLLGGCTWHHNTQTSVATTLVCVVWCQVHPPSRGCAPSMVSHTTSKPCRHPTRRCISCQVWGVIAV